jgi:hypothetical protein
LRCHISLPRSRSRAVVNALIGLVSGLFCWNKGGTINFFVPRHCERSEAIHFALSGWIASLRSQGRKKGFTRRRKEEGRRERILLEQNTSVAFLAYVALSSLFEGNDVLRVDGAYLYDFGSSMRALRTMEEKDCTRIEVYFALRPAYDALDGMVYQSVFRDGWRVVHNSAKELLEEIKRHLIDFNDAATVNVEVGEWSIRSIKTKFENLEAVMKAELQSLALYYVSPKGGFDNRNLIDHGIEIFPVSLLNKCPESAHDVMKGARCIAFELWTAMGFHFHRANEAVLRRYYRMVIGQAKQPKHLTMGTMLSSMEQNDVGDVNIRAALKNITIFHRNPIAHPDHHIETSDEALSLYASIRAAMGYMLDKLPDAVFPAPAVFAAPTPELQIP